MENRVVFRTLYTFSVFQNERYTDSRGKIE